MEFNIKKRLFGGYSVSYCCQRCQAALTSRLDDAGKRYTCPDCGGSFIVPGADARERINSRLTEEKLFKEREREAARIEKQRLAEEWEKEAAIARARTRELAQLAKVRPLRIEDIDVYTGEPDRPYRVLGPEVGKAGAISALHPKPTIQEVNVRLKEAALALGANAVINVSYRRGVAMSSWKALTAHGTAVFLVSDEVKCPYCAEMIRREAIKCRFCGERLKT